MGGGGAHIEVDQPSHHLISSPAGCYSSHFPSRSMLGTARVNADEGGNDGDAAASAMARHGTA